MSITEQEPAAFNPAATTRISSAIDARPMLSRSDDNVWERSEQVRSLLYAQLEEECRTRGMEALVLQSGPYVHPAWVKFEAWRPRAERSLTARSTLVITVTTLPFHRFETTYKVEWQHLGHGGAIDDLFSLDQPTLAGLVNLLCEDVPDVAPLGLRSRMRSLLRSRQLRKVWWHFWKPRNRVVAIRRDWLTVASGLTMALGAGAMLTAFTMNAADPGLSDAAIVEPYAPLEASPADFLLPAPQADLDPITGARILVANQALGSSLGAASNRYDDGRPYELWAFNATAGETIRATVDASEFDALLRLGRIGPDGFEELAMNDDAIGSNPAIDWVAPADGTYSLVAEAYAADGAGAYTVLVESATAAPATQASDVLEGSADESFATVADPEGSAAGTTGMLGGVVFLVGGLGMVASRRAPRLVRSSGKPTAEPRILHYLDSWQTVVFGAGGAEQVIRERTVARLTSAGERFHCGIERIWDWGLDGKIEREQIVLRLGRALVFTQIHRYGDDLYVGWDAQMNLGTWREKPLGSGIDRETGQRIRLQTVEQTLQRTNEYDLIDLNCLAEWTHAQVSQVLKQYLKEQEIDQEIDFSIIRGERKPLTDERDAKGKRKPIFRRSA
jgi:hypothetical protein